MVFFGCFGLASLLVLQWSAEKQSIKSVKEDEEDDNEHPRGHLQRVPGTEEPVDAGGVLEIMRTGPHQSPYGHIGMGKAVKQIIEDNW